MEKLKIAALLDEKHGNLTHWLQSHAAEKWAQGPAGKWTTGQHIIHLIQSTKPLLLGVSLPGFVLRFRFGKANRPSRDYQTIVDRYHEKLAANVGRVSPFSQNMPDTQPDEKEKLIAELTALNRKLNRKMSRFSEAQLDKLVVPHPLMGKMTLREVLLWNAYHTEHHHHILVNKH
ncbi:MAG: DinB family protein [Saprospiraceae bacterium]|nr:DinB family protein [Saprospiraceae bacterium]MCF8250870.1 DinB family protein [Saprospiraceae bacterium]MCF8281126.1 DinB family protein [Bacteroidales bacterium]MCF8312729.1 DinB family protein [Saprospiraceae bacterium]MCF8441176.1 DinB family protein [Saprospiraceae bacterium]